MSAHLKQTNKQKKRPFEAFQNAGALMSLDKCSSGSFCCAAHLHDQLMGARHQSEAVGVVEGFGDVLSEGVASTSGRDAPPTAVVGV